MYEDELNAKTDSQYRNNGFNCRWTSIERVLIIYIESAENIPVLVIYVSDRDK